MEEKYKIHFLYIVAILLAIIVVLVTVKWGKIPDLTRYITFALTLTSLVLAVLAIVYAFLSNSATIRNIAKMDNVSREVSDSSKNVTEATSDLRRNIEEIPSRIQVVDEKITRTHNMIQEYAMRKDVKKEEIKKPTFTDEFIATFLFAGSPSGMLLIYGLSIAYDKKKPVDLIDFIQSIPLLDYTYSHGYLVACSAFQLFSYTQTKNIFSVIEFNDILLKTIKDLALKIIERREDMLKDRGREAIEKIEKYFE